MNTRKALLLVAGIALVSALVAYSQQGGSGNAVGFSMTTVSRDSFGLLAYTFEPLGGTAVPGTLLGTNLPVGTTLYVWDSSGQKYSYESLITQKGVGLTWSPNTNVLHRGHGFWLKIPASAASNEYAVFLVGELPDSDTAPQTQSTILEGFNLIGYPYPAQVIWTNVSLAQAAALGDTLYTFTGSGYQYNTLISNKGVGIQWTVPTQKMVIGKGYWFERTAGAGTVQWNETKPYTWP